MKAFPSIFSKNVPSVVNKNVPEICSRYPLIAQLVQQGTVVWFL